MLYAFITNNKLPITRINNLLKELINVIRAWKQINMYKKQIDFLCLIGEYIYTQRRRFHLDRTR